MRSYNWAFNWMDILTKIVIKNESNVFMLNPFLANMTRTSFHRINFFVISIQMRKIENFTLKIKFFFALVVIAWKNKKDFFKKILNFSVQHAWLIHLFINILKCIFRAQFQSHICVVMSVQNRLKYVDNRIISFSKPLNG